MICFVTALHCEAKPIIERFGLKRDFSVKSHEFFIGSEAALIVSGIGKIRSAIAATLLIKTVQSAQIIVANVGICGATSDEVGTLCLCSKISDSSSLRSLYPDILFKTNLPERSLTTFDTPVNSVIQGLELVDMEAFGFLEASLAFAPPSRVLVLKVVSDMCNGERPTKYEAELLLSKNLDNIEKTVRVYRSHIARKLTFEPYEEYILESCSKSLRLTSSQRRLLDSWALSFKIRRGAGISELQKFASSPVATKTEGKQVFEKIREYLAAP